jgi:hypothetical protein
MIINYSRQSGASDATLNDALLKMLNNDKSTAVRMAAGWRYAAPAVRLLINNSIIQ